MPFLHIDSFEFYQGGGDSRWFLDARWAYAGNVGGYPSGALIPGTGRRASTALRLFGNEGYQEARFDLWAEHTELLYAFAYWVPHANNVPALPIWSFRNAANADQFYIKRTAANRLEVYDPTGPTLLASSADSVIHPGTWQYIEIKFTCDGTDSIIVRIDGVEVINQGGIDLQNVAGGVQIFRLGSYNNQAGNPMATYLDDFVIIETSGAAPNDFLGDVKVVGLLPTADGTYTTMTTTEPTHHDAVNVLGTNYAVDYIEGDAIGEHDSFMCTPDTYLDIHAVEVLAFARDPQAGTNEFKCLLRIDGTDYLGGALTVNDTCDRRSHVWTINPDTAVAFVAADIAALEFGYEVTDLA